MTDRTSPAYVAEWFAAYDAAARRLYGITNMIVTPAQDVVLCTAATQEMTK